jgi:5-methylcytosine-specific restriction endonuclease McrA
MTRKTDGLLLECTCCGKMKPRGQFRNKNRANGKSIDERKKTLEYISQKAPWCKACEKPGAAARHASRRALEKSLGKGYTADDVQELMYSQRGRCRGCNGSLVVLGYHVDHRIPLSKGGRNDKSNLQLLCPPCNLRKSDKLPLENSYAAHPIHASA